MGWNTHSLFYKESNFWRRLQISYFFHFEGLANGNP